MAQYRKKPVVIEAEQFFYDGPRVRGVFYPDLSPDGRTWEGDAFVITIHDQRVYLQSGDWIIAEPDGEHYYPVKPDIFAATYEPLEGDMFARGEMASSPATPETQLSLSESEQLELMVIISRLQSEHSDLIERERVLEAEAADLRRQLAQAQTEWHVMSGALDMAIVERDEAFRQLDAIPQRSIAAYWLFCQDAAPSWYTEDMANDDSTAIDRWVETVDIAPETEADDVPPWTAEELAAAEEKAAALGKLLDSCIKDESQAE